MEGCRGTQYDVQWEDGERTVVCGKGLTWIDNYTAKVGEIELYFVYVDSGVTVDDDSLSEEEVTEVARNKFIDMLLNNQADFLVEQE